MGKIKEINHPFKKEVETRYFEREDEKVVVLDNYPAKDFIWKVWIIETVGVWLVAVDFKESNSLWAMLDIRCIAPVLD